VEARRNRAGHEDIGAFPNLRGLPYIGRDHPIEGLSFIRVGPDTAALRNLTRSAAASAYAQFRRATARFPRT
jgi:hypothetical protein